ncbi:hypothetical protein F5876DRAFT_45554, partial [Lentinula aff. lateritia]
TKGIHVQLYSTGLARPRAITTHVQQNTTDPANSCFVLASHLLAEPRLQPYIHNITLKICHCGKVYEFLVFFKRHKKLPLNLSVQDLGGRDVQGDILLVACGKRVSVWNLCSGLEDKAANKAIKQYVALHEGVQHTD